MIKVTDLTKEFKLSRASRRELGSNLKGAKTVKAVDSISFECVPGRIFGLIGPNGAGKTTTLRMIATMLKPSSGSITVAGHDTQTAAQKVRENIGFMTGQTALYDRLTPTEMVRYMGQLHGMEEDHIRQRREELFEQLNMSEFADRRIGRLSTGMKQKTSIARTMIHDSDVMVFDEPTEGLDVMTSRAIVELIRSCRTDGKTVIFSTHRMGEVKLLCDDIAIIHNGRLFFCGSRTDFETQMTHDSYEDEFIHLVGAA